MFLQAPKPVQMPGIAGKLAFSDETPAPLPVEAKRVRISIELEGGVSLGPPRSRKGCHVLPQLSGVPK